MIQATIQQAIDAAVQHHNAGRLEQAESIYRQVLAYEPDHSNALHLLGVITHQRGRSDEAVDLIRRAIAINPNFANYHFNLANILRDQHKPAEAIAEYRDACKIDPQFTAAHRNLAVALLSSGLAQDAEASFRKVVELQPGSADALNDLAVALTATGRLDESTAAFQAAIRIDPNHAEAHNGLGGNLLLQGDLLAGWPEFEWRWRGAGATSRPPSFSQPQWRGADLRGQTILLHADQGFGDAIQFVRYVPLVAARGGKILLQCPPELRRLFESIPGIHQLLVAGDPLPQFNLHCPLASLPLAFGTTIETISASVPYLRAETRPTRSSGFPIGIAWSGRPTHANDRNRSIPLPMFEPLSKIAGVTLHSLQKDSPPIDVNFQVIDHSGELTDFADTAALITGLDLVISVDTAVAHLAGALAKPTWLLLPFAPDWRWLLARDDSPWYPAMRLFRQPRPTDWQAPIAEVTQFLQKEMQIHHG